TSGMALLPDDPQVLNAIGWSHDYRGVKYPGPLSGEEVWLSKRHLDKIYATGSRSGKKSCRELLSVQTVPDGVLSAILDEYPAAKNSALLYRYVVYALFAAWLDEENGEPVISTEVLEWIAGRRFYDDYHGKDVLAEIAERLPGFEFRDYYHDKSERSKNRARTIRNDGLSPGFRSGVRRSLRRAKGASKLAHLVDQAEFKRGEEYSRERASDL